MYENRNFWKHFNWPTGITTCRRRLWLSSEQWRERQPLIWTRYPGTAFRFSNERTKMHRSALLTLKPLTDEINSIDYLFFLNVKESDTVGIVWTVSSQCCVLSLQLLVPTKRFQERPRQSPKWCGIKSLLIGCQFCPQMTLYTSILHKWLATKTPFLPYYSCKCKMEMFKLLGCFKLVIP